MRTGWRVMSVVKIRELLRDHTAVLERLQANGEPVLLTRNGQAVAALVPVDPQEADRLAVAALPELAARHAGAADARREGRVASAQDVIAGFRERNPDMIEEPPATSAAIDEPDELERFAAETQTRLEQIEREHAQLTRELQGSLLAREAFEDPEQLPSHAEAADIFAQTLGVDESLRTVFGESLARGLSGELAAGVVFATQPVLRLSEADQAAERVYQLNGELFQRLLPGILKQRIGELLATDSLRAITKSGFAVGAPAEGVFGRRFALEALEDLTATVRAFNMRVAVKDPFASGRFSLPIYEAFISGAETIETVERKRAHGREPSGTDTPAVDAASD
jgi:antitoxin (DNA-binding transcriptional repressor) of toxin-antitoxin stability system